MEWMILPFKRYVDFQGRWRRKEFWMFQLLNILVGLLLVTPAIILSPTSSSSDFDSQGDGFSASADFASNFSESPIALVLIGIYALYALATFIPSIAVTVRRFHDRDMSGWWYLGFIVGSALPIIGLLIALGLLVVMAMPGTPGSNRFGPDPKDPFSEDVFA
ncbi:DUF805 domain-containing protein [Erythrobacter sp. sf7]|uniref:DUF805 domain-containing protein n=1 Tax=Erythrobacter fulvus TaxID=2987523 RepID=A0ABT5JPR2_9SPHN|nr:DUF805 domain-containing protein [Erythrobacter fulvus]MDC8754514.1 DUF805 domain-containing protein [Erythrobacter fulvus]